MRFDLTDLRLFLAVIDTGSITGAAAEANLSLSAASERLRDMEAESGVALLERRRRGTVPTEAGEAVAHHARQILRQISHLHGEISKHAEGVRATIRLAANTAAVSEFLPAPLGSFLAAHPEIDIDVRERQSAQIVRAVADGLVDLGIISDAVDAGELRLRPFALDRLVVVARRDHPLARRAQVDFDAVLDQPFVGLTAGALQDYLDDKAAQAGRKLTYRARARTFEGVCCMVAQGVGLAVAPETAVRGRRRAAGVALLRLTDSWATRRLSICFRSEDELAAPARKLVEHLEQAPRRHRAA